MTHRFTTTTAATAFAALLAVPFSAFAHAGTDDGGHHGFLVEWLHSLSEAHYLGSFAAAAGMSLVLGAAMVRQQRARVAARARGVRR